MDAGEYFKYPWPTSNTAQRITSIVTLTILWSGCSEPRKGLAIVVKLLVLRLCPPPARTSPWAAPARPVQFRPALSALLTLGKIGMETELSPGPGKSEWLAMAWIPGARGPTLLSEVLSQELWLQAQLHCWAWRGIGGGLGDYDRNKTQRNCSWCW